MLPISKTIPQGVTSINLSEKVSHLTTSLVTEYSPQYWSLLRHLKRLDDGLVDGRAMCPFEIWKVMWQAYQSRPDRAILSCYKHVYLWLVPTSLYFKGCILHVYSAHPGRNKSHILADLT